MSSQYFLQQQLTAFLRRLSRVALDLPRKGFTKAFSKCANQPQALGHTRAHRLGEERRLTSGRGSASLADPTLARPCGRLPGGGRPLFFPRARLAVRRGGSAWELNPPRTFVGPHDGFEVRAAHQRRSAPVDGGIVRRAG